MGHNIAMLFHDITDVVKILIYVLLCLTNYDIIVFSKKK